LEEKLFPAGYANIISALMPVSRSLLRVKTTVGNWQVWILTFGQSLSADAQAKGLIGSHTIPWE
jgi:hypothetical protein